MKISIIIPIYNVESYIGKCLDSIINQTFNNIEIIVVDDGGIDNSKNIVKEYAQKDKRIKLYSKKNGGAADARNYGLTKATGEYIMHIDGDDFLYSNSAIKDIYDKLLKTNCEVLFYRMIKFYQDSSKYEESNRNAFKNQKFKNKYELLQCLNQTGDFKVSPCEKIIKKDILLKNNIKFIKGIVCEDIDWTNQIYNSASEYAFLDKNIYVYRKQREDSVTKSTDSKNINSLLYVIQKWIDYDYGMDISFKNITYSNMAYWYTILLSMYNKKNTNYLIRKNIKNIKWLLSYDDNYKVKKVRRFNQYFGFYLTKKLLYIYRCLRANGTIQI